MVHVFFFAVSCRGPRFRHLACRGRLAKGFCRRLAVCGARSYAVKSALFSPRRLLSHSCSRLCVVYAAWRLGRTYRALVLQKQRLASAQGSERLHTSAGAFFCPTGKSTTNGLPRSPVTSRGGSTYGPQSEPNRAYASPAHRASARIGVPHASGPRRDASLSSQTPNWAKRLGHIGACQKVPAFARGAVDVRG